ncbi:hypothetical protein [Aquisphaera insulae]|uniref:hypothetical protein n=1 Tax=Aquisphaera insulae TaxID=2712864 RepID=UPI0013EB38CE|nr:hypothetical protein [Aquisphaera insulae]
MSEPESGASEGPKPQPKPQPPPGGELFCLRCGARNDPGSAECWLCGERALSTARPVGPSPGRPSGGNPFVFTIAGGMLVIAVVAVCLALYANAPGLLVLLAATVAPALAIVQVQARRRRRRGDPMSGAERFGCFMVYLILAPVLLIGAAIIALLIYCSVVGGPNFH